MLIKTRLPVMPLVSSAQISRLTSVNMSVRSAPSRLLYTLRDDVNRPQRLPSVGERIKAEGVFGAGAAGDGVVCEFRHGVCGGEFILENVKVDASPPQ